MTLPFLQADYGAFDTKFLGVCLRFHSDAPDSFEKLLALVTGEPSAHANFDHESLHDLAVASVLDHEFRHLHDFVLSTHGNKIFRLRLAAFFNGMQSIGAGFSVLPVPTPLLRWSRLTEEERRSQEQLWAQQVLPLDRLDAAALAQAAKNYAQIRRCMVAESEIQPVDLYEASAVLAQVFAIDRIAGKKSALMFLKEIVNGSVPSRYVRVLRSLFTLWRKLGRDADAHEFAAVVSWSLLGTFGKQPDDDPPTQRFFRLLEHLTREQACDFGCGLKDLYAGWDAALGYVSIEEAIRENGAANEEFARWFDSVPPDSGDTLFRAITETCREGIQTLIAANNAVASVYLANPDSYVYPDAYIDSGRNLLAPVRVDFLDMGYRSDALRGCGFEVDVEILDSQSREQVALTATLHPNGPNAIDGRVASRVAIQLMVSDYLFSDLSRDDWDFRLARQKLREIGVATLELL
ncbi:hypothetical protein [Paraburkholderia sp. 35.1]|uniref:hypothetical protein n=1 Tax=Paraburkholderia sp. 35.1 TaxID=2991058 RepID=UPI003D1FEEA6